MSELEKSAPLWETNDVEISVKYLCEMHKSF